MKEHISHDALLQELQAEFDDLRRKKNLVAEIPVAIFDAILRDICNEDGGFSWQDLEEQWQQRRPAQKKRERPMPNTRDFSCPFPENLRYKGCETSPTVSEHDGLIPVEYTPLHKRYEPRPRTDRKERDV